MELSGKRLWWLAGGALVLIGIPTAILWHKVDRIARMERFIAKGQKSEVLTLKSVTASLDKVAEFLGKKGVVLPGRLASIPSAEQLGIVKKTRTIDLDPILGACNGSIIETGSGGYHMVFRYDVSKELWKAHPFYS